MSYKFTSPVAIQDHGQIPHPGALVRVIIEDHDLTISSAARAIKMDRATLSKVTTGEHMVSRELAFKLGALLGDEVADLLVNAARKYEDQEGERLRAHYKELIPALAA